jgi:hypothetical protein
MATKITVPLDEALVRRARDEDAAGEQKTDEQVVEDALSVYLGLRALDDARAQGTLSPDEADRLAVSEVKAARAVRSLAA